MTARRLRDDIRTWENAHGLFAYDPLEGRVFQLPVAKRAELEALLARGDKRLVPTLEEIDLLQAGRLEPLRRVAHDHQKIHVARRQLPSDALTFWPEMRFSCVACGESCRSIERGPLRQSERTRLLALPLAELGVRPEEVFYAKDSTPVAESNRLFFGIEGRNCAFLLEDGRCRLHASFGYESKPLMCRQFPFFFVGTPSGLSVGARLPECSSVTRTTLGETALAQRLELEGMVEGQPSFELVPPMLWADTATLVEFGDYAAWEAGFLANSGESVSAGVLLDQRLGKLAPTGAASTFDASAVVQSFAARARRDQAAISGDAVLKLVADRVVDVFAVAAEHGGSGPALSHEALAVDRLLARHEVWNKQLFDSPTLADGLGVLAARSLVARRFAMGRASERGLSEAHADDVVKGWRAAQAATDHEAIVEAGFSAAALASWVRALSC